MLCFCLCAFLVARVVTRTEKGIEGCSTYVIGWCPLTMSTDQEPPVSAKLFHLIFLSTFWGMQIWVTFISGKSLVL